MKNLKGFLAVILIICSYYLLTDLFKPELMPHVPSLATLHIDRVGFEESSEPLYGLVMEHELPWYQNESPHLTGLRLRFSANNLINAFMITITDPIWQETTNIRVATQNISGAVVSPNETFSLNRTIGPRTRERGFGDGPIYSNGQIQPGLGGGICKVATTMYNAIIFSDLPVLERHSHSMLVPYVPPGRDATILWGVKDLRFKNNKDTPIIVWSTLEDDKLYVALYGQYQPPNIQWIHEELERTQTWTIKRPNPSLSNGEERVITGYDGISVRTKIQVQYPDESSRELNLGIDRYNPLPTLIEYGSK